MKMIAVTETRNGKIVRVNPAKLMYISEATGDAEAKGSKSYLRFEANTYLFCNETPEEIENLVALARLS